LRRWQVERCGDRSRSRDRTRDVGHPHPSMIASMVRRGGQIRGLPRRPGRAAGRCAAITCHWASVRSLGYLTRLPARRLPWARAGSRVFLAVTNRDHEARALHQPGTTRPLLPRWPLARTDSD
jgi:hypothetical protein